MSPVRALPLAVWFPAVRTSTGTDTFTERLCEALNARGTRAEIEWLPHRAEYLPWTVAVPQPPAWATVVHVNTWLHPRFIPRNLPIVATLHHSIHDPVLRPYKGGLRTAYHRWWIAPNERRVLRRAQHVVAVSRFVADMARKTLCDVSMEVIHNGIDTAHFRPGRRCRQTNEPFRLLYVGNWMIRKGVDLLAPIMRELGGDFELLYTGGEAAAVDKPGMPSNMRDVGRLSSAGVLAAMQESDVFLFPSRSEGLPLVAIEAMACGLPVFGVRESSVSEVVDHGVTGLLCPRDDVAAFVAAALALAGDSMLHGSMAQAAHRNAIARFSLQSMVSAYARVYQALHDAST